MEDLGLEVSYISSIIYTSNCKKALVGGYSFNSDEISKKDNLLSFWRCDKYAGIEKCKNRIHVKNDVVIKSLPEHSHLPSAGQIRCLRAVDTLRNEAASTLDNPQQIIDRLNSVVPESAFGNIPNKSSLKRGVQRKRQLVNAPPPNPVNLLDLTLPPEFKVLDMPEAEAQTFLRFDTKGCEIYDGYTKRFIIFASDRAMQLLEKPQLSLYCDGTFKICPSLFYQLYTVHGRFESATYPLLYILMSRKTQIMYIQVWEEIRRMRPQINVTWLMTDFESGAMKAVRTIVPESEITGCFFHLTQNIRRQIQVLGLMGRYRLSVNFAEKCRMLPALAMLLADHVLSTFEQLLLDNNLYPNEFDGQTEYFESVYIGRPGRRNGRAPAMFAYPVWNVHSRIISNDPKTNNCVEGWHRGMQSRVTCSHPTVFRLIDVLKSSARDVNVTYTQVISGIAKAPSQSAIYAAIALRLNNCVHRYLNGGYGDTNDFATRIEFLKAVSRNYEFDN